MVRVKRRLHARTCSTNVSVEDNTVSTGPFTIVKPILYARTRARKCRGDDCRGTIFLDDSPPIGEIETRYPQLFSACNTLHFLIRNFQVQQKILHIKWFWVVFLQSAQKPHS